jgi:hypothetical protein
MAIAIAFRYPRTTISVGIFEKNAVHRQRYSRKRLGKCALGRVTNENMHVYTQI